MALFLNFSNYSNKILKTIVKEEKHVYGGIIQECEILLNEGLFLFPKEQLLSTGWAY